MSGGGFGGLTGPNQSRNAVIQTTYNATDSYNSSWSQVYNLSNVGNVAMTVPSEGSELGSVLQPNVILPLAIASIIGLVAMVIFVKH